MFHFFMKDSLSFEAVCLCWSSLPTKPWSFTLLLLLRFEAKSTHFRSEDDEGGDRGQRSDSEAAKLFVFLLVMTDKGTEGTARKGTHI